jgi:dolichyl-phosphate beta-glucosyltransferase
MDVSLVVPIYNAEKFLQQSLKEIDQALLCRAESWELVLVIDGATDASERICREFAASPRSYSIEILVNEKNIGKGGAIQRGMVRAVGRYRLFNDCDLAYPMTEVFKVLRALQEGRTIAVASRSMPDSRYIFSPKNFRYLYTRHLASRVLNFLIKKFFIPTVADTQAGLKGFQGGVADFLFSQMKLQGFSFDLELLHIAYRAGIPVCEVAVDLHAQRVSTVNFPVEVFRMVRDLLRILSWTYRGKYNFSWQGTEAPEARAS